VDYPVKTLGQLRPILQGFRKASGLTQAMMASRLGVTQQTYAALEANPASASVERLFKVLRVLNAQITLNHGAASSSARRAVAKIAPASGSGRRNSNAAARPAQKDNPPKPAPAQRAARTVAKNAVKGAGMVAAKTVAPRSGATTQRAKVSTPAARKPAASSIRKRENW